MSEENIHNYRNQCAYRQREICSCTCIHGHLDDNVLQAKKSGAVQVKLCWGTYTLPSPVTATPSPPRAPAQKLTWREMVLKTMPKAGSGQIIMYALQVLSIAHHHIPPNVSGGIVLMGLRVRVGCHVARVASSLLASVSLRCLQELHLLSWPLSLSFNLLPT